MSKVALILDLAQFKYKEQEVARTDGFQVTAFRFPSGVAAIRVKNRNGEFTMLPFQGQQVWDARFNGRRLTMKSMFDAPKLTQDFLHTYGALLVHCGATAVGPPGPGDSHPPHGELPNANFDKAWLEFSDDTLSICGEYRHTVAFQTDYVFSPRLTIKCSGTAFDVGVNVRNKKRTPMPLFYLAHVNFRASGGTIIHDNAVSTSMRDRLPSHVTPSPAYLDLLARLSESVEVHRAIGKDDQYDPELVLFPRFNDGKALAVAEKTDGLADFIEFDTSHLPHALRWISKTPDQECLGLLLPATCEAEGLSRELQKGNVTMVDAGAIWFATYRFGMLDEAELKAKKDEIEALNAAAEG